MSTSEGKVVVDPSGHKWVRFDVANEREGKLVTLGRVDGKRAWFNCSDNLEWIGGVYSDLEE